MLFRSYQFWDAAHHHIEISHDVKFNETLFPVKEVTKSQASMNDLPISESDNDSDQSGLELVIPIHSSPRPPSPGQSAPRSRSQTQTHPNPPIAPPVISPGAQPSRSGQPSAQPSAQPQYSLRQTKEWIACQPQPSGENINAILVNIFQEVPNSYRKAMSLEDSAKWLAASQEEFKGLTKMGVWKLVDHPHDHKTIKCRWTYVLKSNSRKAS